MKSLFAAVLALICAVGLLPAQVPRAPGWPRIAMALPGKPDAANREAAAQYAQYWDAIVLNADYCAGAESSLVRRTLDLNPGLFTFLHVGSNYTGFSNYRPTANPVHDALDSIWLERWGADSTWWYAPPVGRTTLATAITASQTTVTCATPLAFGSYGRCQPVNGLGTLLLWQPSQRAAFELVKVTAVSGVTVTVQRDWGNSAPGSARAFPVGTPVWQLPFDASWGPCTNSLDVSPGRAVGRDGLRAEQFWGGFLMRRVAGWRRYFSGGLMVDTHVPKRPEDLPYYTSLDSVAAANMGPDSLLLIWNVDGNGGGRLPVESRGHGTGANLIEGNLLGGNNLYDAGGTRDLAREILEHSARWHALYQGTRPLWLTWDQLEEWYGGGEIYQMAVPALNGDAWSKKTVWKTQQPAYAEWYDEWAVDAATARAVPRDSLTGASDPRRHWLGRPQGEEPTFVYRDLPGPGLLADGGFEAGLGGWALHLAAGTAGTVGIARAMPHRHSGAAACSLEIVEPGPTNNPTAIRLVSAPFTLAGPGTHSLDLWLASTQPLSVDFQVRRGPSLVRQGEIFVRGPWRRFALAFPDTAVGTAAWTVEIDAGFSEGKGASLFLDDVRVLRGDVMARAYRIYEHGMVAVNLSDSATVLSLVAEGIPAGRYRKIAGLRYPAHNDGSIIADVLAFPAGRRAGSRSIGQAFFLVGEAPAAVPPSPPGPWSCFEARVRSVRPDSLRVRLGSSERAEVPGGRLRIVWAAGGPFPATPDQGTVLLELPYRAGLDTSLAFAYPRGRPLWFRAFALGPAGANHGTPATLFVPAHAPVYHEPLEEE